ncbi:hypothetical protein V5G20_18000 [Brevibacillus borstelensis]
MLYDIIRNLNTEVSRIFDDNGRTIYDYDGGFEPYEDPADYVSVKAVRIG